MPNLTTDRATKKAYFTDLDGNHLVQFQFTPDTLEFIESGLYIDRIPIGKYFNNLTWISGKPNTFELRLFVDRTQESYLIENYNQSPFDSVTRFPNQHSETRSLDILNLLAGIKNSNTSSGFASNFRDQGEKTSNKVTPTSYNASPDYPQTAFNEGTGVMPDIEALLYYVRPKGLKLSEITIQRSGEVRIDDFDMGRFIPPPMVRFYYGNLWREGYIVDVKYTLSVMNKLLVPRRLDAQIKIACTNWGYLTDLNDESLEGSEDFNTVDPNKFSNLA